MKIRNKKGIELTLQTIIVFIILVMVLFVMIFFFVNHYGGNSDKMIGIGTGAIDQARNFT